MRWVLSLLISVVLAGHGMATTATLAWDAPTTGIPDQYLLYHSTDGQVWELVLVLATPHQTWMGNVSTQGKHCFRVTAYNSTGESVPSQPLCVRCNPHRCRTA